MSIRILLVDDHEIFADGLAALLAAEHDMHVVGTVADSHESLQRAVQDAPDVVVMDISMPGMNGIETTRRITKERPETKVLCLSMHGERRFVQAALEAGASGYVLKECALDEVALAIRTVGAGRTYLSPGVAGVVVDAMRDRRNGTDTSAFSVLTDRERAVLQLLAEGHSSKEIATRLHVSIKTVGTHREKIMSKLDINSVAGLTKYAIREGLTES
jgi:DNA-binding NarL/FixJ family response regulator